MDRYQVLFLVDVARKEKLSREVAKELTRSTCSACFRILLHLCPRPHERSQVKWAYQLFHSEKQVFVHKGKGAKFVDLCSESLEKFCSAVLLAQDERSDSDCGHHCDKTPPIRVVYRVLAAVVQDYPWDTPQIVSPIIYKVTRKQRSLSIRESLHPKNLIFIVSELPSNQTELVHFVGVDATNDSALCHLGKLMPQPLVVQLQERGVAVHWLQTTPTWKAVAESSHNQKVAIERMMGSVLRQCSGSIIPQSFLVTMTSKVGSFLNHEAVESSSVATPDHTPYHSHCQPAIPPDSALSFSLSSTKPPASGHSYQLLFAQGGQLTCVIKTVSLGQSLSRPSSNARTERAVSDSIAMANMCALIPSSILPPSCFILSESCSCVGYEVSQQLREKLRFKAYSKRDPSPAFLETETKCLGSPDLPDNANTEECLSPAVFPPDLLSLDEQGDELTQFEAHLPPQHLSKVAQMKYRINDQPKDSHSFEEKPQNRISLTPLCWLDMLPSASMATTTCTSSPLPPPGPVPVLSENEPTSVINVEAPFPTLGEIENSICEDLSPYFQSICLFLARNRCNLLLKIRREDGTIGTSLLQPVTSVMATITPLRPGCIPTQSSCQAKLVTTPHKHTHNHSNYEVQDYSTPRQLLDQELFASVTSLFPASADDTANDDLALLFDRVPVLSSQPFSPKCLSSWASLQPSYGLPSQIIDAFQEVQRDLVIESMTKSNHAHLLSELQLEYSQRLHLGHLNHCNCSCSEEAESIAENTEVNSEKDKGVNYDGQLKNFLNEYAEKTADVYQFRALLDWAKKHILNLANNSISMEKLWADLWHQVLLSDSQLKEKHREEPHLDRLRNISSECRLQILLHFTAFEHCLPVISDHKSLADNVVNLLRCFSTSTNPRTMTTLLEETILPHFESKCPQLLVAVYEGLMLPLPPHLSSSESPLSVGDVKEPSSSDSYPEPTLRSLEEVYGLGLEEESHTTSRRFTRHASLIDQRQITVLKKRRKSSHRKEQHGNQPAPVPTPSATSVSEEQCSQRVRRNLFTRSVSMNATSSSSNHWWAKRERDEDQSMPAKKVKEFSKHTVVKQTPDRKQTSDYWWQKMMRRRSKSVVENSPGTQVIEESPRRLFYSSSSASSHPLPVPGVSLLDSKEAKCITPPHSHPCSHLQLKDPSPAAIFSLLHGEMMSPPLFPTTSGHSTSLSSTHHSNKSPDMFGTDHTPSLPSDSAPPVRTYRAARSLTYLSESPLVIHSPDDAQNTTPVKSILKTPERALTPKSTEKKSVTFDMGLDFQQDSASRVAFALSTPTKDDVVDFTGCLDIQGFAGCLDNEDFTNTNQC